MATRQREPISPRWPAVATSASLPNVAGSPTQSSYLQAGDECYVSADSALYVCVVATLGAAVWRIIGASGTYTPTGTIVTNLDSVTPVVSTYVRVGNVVCVFGRVGVDPTASGSLSFRLSLPIASNFGSTTDATGYGQIFSPFVQADATNDALLVTIPNNSVSTSYTFFFSASYRVI